MLDFIPAPKVFTDTFTARKEKKTDCIAICSEAFPDVDKGSAGNRAANIFLKKIRYTSVQMLLTAAWNSDIGNVT